MPLFNAVRPGANATVPFDAQIYPPQAFVTACRQQIIDSPTTLNWTSCGIIGISSGVIYGAAHNIILAALGAGILPTINVQGNQMDSGNVISVCNELMYIVEFLSYTAGGVLLLDGVSMGFPGEGGVLCPSLVYLIGCGWTGYYSDGAGSGISF